MNGLLFLVLSLAALASSDVTEEEGVRVLTNDNFDAAIAEHQHILGKLVNLFIIWAQQVISAASSLNLSREMLSHCSHPFLFSRILRSLVRTLQVFGS